MFPSDLRETEQYTFKHSKATDVKCFPVIISTKVFTAEEIEPEWLLTENNLRGSWELLGFGKIGVQR